MKKLFLIGRKHTNGTDGKVKLLYCSLYLKFEDRIKGCKNFKGTYLKGSDNFRVSSLQSHHGSDMHSLSTKYNDQMVNKSHAQVAGFSKFVSTKEGPINKCWKKCD